MMGWRMMHWAFLAVGVGLKSVGDSRRLVLRDGPLARIGRNGQRLELSDRTMAAQVGLDRLLESLGRFPERRVGEDSL